MAVGAVRTDRSRVKGGILTIPSKTLESFSSWSPIDISESLGVIRAALIERLRPINFRRQQRIIIIICYTLAFL